MPVKEAAMEAELEAGFENLAQAQPTGGWASQEAGFDDYVREGGHPLD